MLLSVVECVVGAWLRVCGRACLEAQAPNVSRETIWMTADLSRGVGGCWVGLGWVLNNCAGGVWHCSCCPSSEW